MAKVATKTYQYDNGESGRSAKPGFATLTFTFANDESIVVNPTEFPPEIRQCAEGFGYSEKIGNAYAGAKGDADIAYEKAMDMVESLMGGTWVAEGEGAGPRDTMLLEAVKRAKEAKGQEFNEAAVRERLADKAQRTALAKIPEVEVELKAIAAERAVERAKKARAALKKGADASEGLSAI